MGDRMTIDELARRAGMTVRNVREHQSRGLLEPPTVEGRRGYYGARHLARLRLIRDLQSEGLNLQAIAWLLEQAPAEATEEAERLRRALSAPWSTEEPRTYTVADLVARFGPTPVATRDRAVALGLLRPAGEGRWEAPAPRLVEAGAQLVELGVDPEAALDVLETLIVHLDAVAQRFVELFLADVWAAFDAAGRPAEGWEHVRTALERLRPTASEAVTAVLQLRMDGIVGRAIAERAPELRGTPP